MPIPHQERVSFKRNPIVEVIFQARFPRLLTLDSEIPSKFHAAIGTAYPAVDVVDTLQVPVGPVSSGAGLPGTRRQYNFSSEDGLWKIGLNSEFIALTATSYTTWGAFRERIEALLTAFFSSYRPAFVNRIGLRYVDRISRNALQLSAVPWNELLKPHILGPLAGENLVAEDVAGTRGVFVLKLRDDLLVQVQHGLVDGRESETEFLIDCDFYTEKKIEATTHAAIGTLDGFRPLPNDLFRWCITPRLYNAMEPEPPSGT